MKKNQPDSHHDISKEEVMNIGLPRYFNIEFLPDYIKISKKRPSIHAVFTFTIAVLIVLASLLVRDTEKSQLGIMFAVIFYLPALVFIVLSIYYWVNSTYIFASKKTIEIKQHPLPWFGNKKIDVTEIKQLFSSRYISDSRNSDNSKRTVSYSVDIITLGGATYTFLSRLKESNHALFIEQEIEEYLGIEDIRVRGELSPHKNISAPSLKDMLAIAKGEITENEYISIQHKKEKIETYSLPKMMEIFNNYDHLKITRRWYRKSAWLMLVGGIVWLAIIGFTEELHMASSINIDDYVKLFVLSVAPVAFILVAFVQFVNKTEIFVSKEVLIVRHYPIPWFGSFKISSENIKQLYAKEKIKSSGDNIITEYATHLISHDNKEIVLVKSLKDRKHALFIEQEIEKYLNIKDKKVRGELG